MLPFDLDGVKIAVALSEQGAMTDEKPYHHGNLAETLARAAEDLLRDRGLHGFSLRECARRAGVAHSAPGHHFGDVAGLLTEVAARGFDRLTAAMATARGDTAGNLALARIGQAYVDFALANREVFYLMFQSDRVDRSSARLARAATAAYGGLADVIATLKGTPPPAPDLHFAWSAIHGLSLLLADGRLDPAEATQAVIDRIVRGVSLPGQ